MKIVNIILGIGTTIIMGSLIVLGIAAFYPSPVAPDYGTMVAPAPPPPVATPCAAGDTACAGAMKQYQAEQQAKEDAFNQAQTMYQDAMRVYDRNLFIIGNLLGVAIFAAGFWLFFASWMSARGVPVGIMLAGLWGIMYGYGKGWGSVDDQLKFFIGLIVAVFVIGGSVWLVNRYERQ